MALVTADYLVIPKPCPDVRARLLCFPHSGGSASFFHRWGELLFDNNVEVVVISLPGRERRIGVNLVTDWRVLVKEICTATLDSGLVDGPPYAFFGHSLGALIAYEVASRLDEILVRGQPRPVCLFASGHGHPAASHSDWANRGHGGSGLPWGSLHLLADADLVAAIQRFGILEPELTSNKDALDLVLPAFRADFRLYETYSPRDDQLPLSIPIVALGGRQDPIVSEAQLDTWRTATVRPFEPPVLFEGGHFYFQHFLEKVIVGTILPKLQTVLDSLPRSAIGSKHPVPEICGTHTIVDRFLERVGEVPGALGIIEDSEIITYKDLADRTRLLASTLFGEFLREETGKVVALLTPHDGTYVASMLSIWMARAIVLVIEAHFNPELCAEMCEECNAVAAICTSQYAPKFIDASGCKTLVLDGNTATWAAKLLPKWSVPPTLPGLADTALLMMTSGTTGRPKTIAGDHRFMHIGQLSKIAHAPYTEIDQREAFNVMFVWEVLRPLLFGLTSFIISDDAVLETSKFLSFLEKHGCTRVLTTPSLLSTILQIHQATISISLKNMRTWFVCGEVMPISTVEKFIPLLPYCQIVNIYSSWEAADSSVCTVAPRPSYMPSKIFSACGEAAMGACLVVVDPDTRKCVPICTVGELYVGGSMQSQGYYLKPEFTKERFVEPFTPEMKAFWPGTWYKTGDAARLLGEPLILEIRGRMDSTVKIRGFKVGLAVIEAAIKEIPAVGLCGCVPVYSAPGVVDSLVLFMQPKPGISFEALASEVKREGVKKMPRWMMPTTVRLMPNQAFSGGEARKLDRRQLQRLAQQEYDVRGSVSEAEAKEETVLAADHINLDNLGVRGVVRAVWAQTLNLNIASLDTEENFFDLGGHSVLAANMVFDLTNKYGLKVSVLDIYANSTLGALLDFLDPVGLESLSAPSYAISGQPIGTQDASLLIVGLAGRFPGASDVDEFWNNLSSGIVSATFLSKDFLRTKGMHSDTIAHKDFIPCAYMIEDADKFDNVFFGISRHEAALMDPQHRVFIETTWTALENAALKPRTGLSDVVVGVFAAAGIDGYMVHHLDGMPLKNTMDPNDIFLAEIGNEKDYIATRIAYLMDFTGPTMNVNSACSSALVAVCMGCSAITSGLCDAAVAGGSSITFPNLGYLYMDGLVASADGYVRPFDKDADGTVFGDSCGSVVIRRDVVRRDLSWGTVRGFGLSNDGGKKAGFAAPSSAGQAQAIRNALRMMSESPWSLSYIECHATGTRIGDGIEVKGLLDAMHQVGGKVYEDHSVLLGSVKGNIGHANCAAGITGLAKLLVQLRSKQMAPVANYRFLNPKIDFGTAPCLVASELCSWDVNHKIRRGGVSSFGIGGTNAHCIVDETEQPTRSRYHASSVAFQVLPFSAKSPSALKRCVEKVARSFLAMEDKNQSDSLADVAFTLQTARTELLLRRALVVKTSVDQNLAEVGEVMVKAVEDERELDDVEEAAKKPLVAFIFPGQGSQYFGMGRQLYEQVPLFRVEVDTVCELFSKADFLGFDIRPFFVGAVAGTEKETELMVAFDRPSVLQPCLFVVEYALAQVFLGIGVRPAVVAGHSLGEYTAAVIGGLLTLEAACAIVASRARATETLAAAGSMLSVADWTTEELDTIRCGQRKGLWVAAINSPSHAVISGETGAIDALVQELKIAGKKCTKLHVHNAFHSGLIEQAAETLRGVGAPLNEFAAEIPVASNLTGSWLSAELMKTGNYWRDHMRGTVLWRKNVESIMNEYEPAVFLEMGPMNVLSTLTKRCIGTKLNNPTFIQGMRHPTSSMTDAETLVSAIAQLWERGCAIDWNAVHLKVLGAGSSPHSIRLPGYAFDKTSLWVNPQRSSYVDSTSDPAPALYAKAANASDIVDPKTFSAIAKAGLVRFADRGNRSEPQIRVYCLPYAGGSSRIFAPWAALGDAIVEIIAVELPGRGARSDDEMPSRDVEDFQLLDDIVDGILSDLQGSQYALVGFSMGGNLSVELALRLSARGAQPPLAVYLAGRKPPAKHPADVRSVNMSTEELVQYAFVPPRVSGSLEFIEHMVPLLRADLELDARAERRLSATSLEGQRLSSNVGFELSFGTSDDIAPFAEALGWQRYAEAPVGLNYYPGGHEFMSEQRSLIFAACRRDFLGRFLQRRTSELALISNVGAMSSGYTAGCASAISSRLADTRNLELLPFYSVRWVPAIRGGSTFGKFVPRLLNLRENSELAFEAAKKALLAGQVVVVLCGPPQEAAGLQWFEDEVALSWHFVRLVQIFLDAGVSGRVVIVCPASTAGAMVVGASKAVSLEAGDLKFQRVFIPTGCFTSMSESALMSRACEYAEAFSEETDIWLRTDSLAGPAYTARIERVAEPSAKLLCVPQHTPSGVPAVYVLTGATGGLGSAVVEWLIREQRIPGERLVLLRRAGSRPLSALLATCRSLEVAAIDRVDALMASALRDITGIAGIFHLAGVLDDGIVQHMTKERIKIVAQPKCGLLMALLETATQLGWPLQWVMGFSSTSSLFGYGGQVNYSAANAVLDQMATFSSGFELADIDYLPFRFITVNWGPWGEAGMAQAGTKAYEKAISEGDHPLKTTIALRCLAAALRHASSAQATATQFCACDVEWQKSTWTDLPILNLVHDSSAQPRSADASATHGDSIKNFLVQHTKGGSWKRVQAKTLLELGLDSLEVVQIRGAFNKLFGVTVPMATFADVGQKLVEIEKVLEKALTSRVK